MLAYRYRQAGIIMTAMNHAVVHTSETSRKRHNKEYVSGGWNERVQKRDIKYKKRI